MQNIFKLNKNKSFLKTKKIFTSLIIFATIFNAFFFTLISPVNADSTSTCTVSGSTSLVIISGQSVTWNVTVSGNLPATITWSGDEGLTGTGASISKTYSTTGIKNASVTAVITSDGSTSIDCGSVLSITNIPSPIGMPTVDLKVNGGDAPVTFSSGGSVSLSWTATNSASCTASGDWSGSKTETGGSEVVGPLTSSKTFTITCTNSSGTATDSVSAVLDIITPPATTTSAVCNMTATTTSAVVSGQSVTWLANFTTNNTITSIAWSGDEGLTGSASTTSKTYTTAGLKNASVTVTVNGVSPVVNCSSITSTLGNIPVVPPVTPAPTVDLKVNGGDGPLSLNVGEALNLSWTAINATSCSASGSWTGNKIATSSTEIIGPLNTATTSAYSITCLGVSGVATDTVNIIVLATSTPVVPPVIPPVIPPTPPASGRSGGGGGSSNLYIYNERIEEIVPGIAFVQWDTNRPASSRVVYGQSSVSNTTGINYGYTSSTIESSNPLIVSHGMAVLDLRQGGTYYFRPFSSNGSQNALGQELILTPQSSSAGCQYLYDYMHIGWQNNPVEVRKLQYFLRDLEGESVAITGVFDEQTYRAVSVFQNKYKTDILTPWGHDSATGFVYILTKKKVNEIYCKMAFPVTVAQENEIVSFKAFMENLKKEGLTTSPTTPGGVPNIIVPTTTPKGQNLENINEVGLNIASSTLATTNSPPNSPIIRPFAGVASVAIALTNQISKNVLYILTVLLILLTLFGGIFMTIKDKNNKGQNTIWTIRLMTFVTGLVIITIVALIFKIYYLVISLGLVALLCLPILLWLASKRGNDIELSEVDLN